MQCLVVKQAIKQLLWKPVNFSTLMQPLTSIQHTFKADLWHRITVTMQFHLICQIRKFLSPQSMETLLHAFVTSHLDCCNSLLFGIPKYETGRLQNMVNDTAQLISWIPKFDHISSTLSHLHWEEYLQPHFISGHTYVPVTRAFLRSQELVLRPLWATSVEQTAAWNSKRSECSHF